MVDPPQLHEVIYQWLIVLILRFEGVLDFLCIYPFAVKKMVKNGFREWLLNVTQTRFFWSSRKVSNGRLAEEEKSLDLLPDAQVERIKKCLGKPLLRNKLLLP